MYMLILIISFIIGCFFIIKFSFEVLNCYGGYKARAAIWLILAFIAISVSAYMVNLMGLFRNC